ncbi:condensation domain-containing protein [Nocardiopsis sp. CA-288880]|uniref:condensation domain-containing protein n=1 Tax=Nocardiopsis sp. CA-288880 TaxID=3239995 RepID=UPI003D964201
MTTVRMTTVPVIGEQVREGPATWGQRTTWRHLQWFPEDHRRFNMQEAFEIAPGADLDAVLSAVADLVTGNVTLRTRLSQDESGALRQRAEASGALPVEIVETGDREQADLLAVVEGISERLRLLAFDPALGWPLRVAVLVHGGRPRALVLSLSHVATDGVSLRVLVERAQALIADRAAGRAPARSHRETELLEIAAFESGETGRSLSDAAIRHWCRALREASEPVFSGPPLEVTGARYRSKRIRSSALNAAVHVIARQHRVSTAMVFLAGLSTVLARHTGGSRVLMKVVANNRTADVAHIVCPMAQDGVFAAVRPSGGLDRTLRDSWGPAMRAHRHARYDPDRLDEAIAEMERERGHALGITCCVNDRRRDQRTSSELAHTPRERLEELLGDTEVEDAGSYETHDLQFFAQIDSDERFADLSVTVDTRHISRDDLGRIPLLLESLMVRAAQEGERSEDGTQEPRAGSSVPVPRSRG